MKKFPFLMVMVAGSVVLSPPLLLRAQVPISPTASQPASDTANPAQQGALTQLLNGVKEIDAPGLPGAVGVYGPNAFGVVGGKSGKDSRLPVVAAAFAGKSRVVAFGHDGYLNAESLQKGDSGRLMDNALSWVAGGKKPAKIGVIGDEKIAKTLQNRGYDAQKTTPDNLAGYNTLVVNGHALKMSDLAAMQAFLARGGGLVMATTGWGWNYNTPELKLSSDFVGNFLLAPYGLVWTSGTLDKTSKDGFIVQPLSPLTNASWALNAVTSGATKGTENDQAGAILGDVLGGLPQNDTLLMPQLKDVASGAKGDIVPFERRPVTTAEPLARLTLTLQSRLLKDLPASEVKPHPAGAIFPGEVPPNFKPVSKTVAVDTQIPKWHSTGLYAAPGATITLQLPDGVAPEGLQVRIGAHTDQLWHLDKWQRHPDISRIWKLNAGETKVANPFGGLVYVVVPDGAKARNVNVSISGAHEAPLFVAGKTNLNDWKNTIRWAPGPWAEIATPQIVLTVPSRAIRDLEDPTAIVKYYEAGMKATDELFALKKSRPYAERILADVQISAGYMHAGYPIMTFLDVEKKTIDINSMNESMWGHWHEVGHNFQKTEWTFEGTGEVTNNLLPMYVWTQLLKKPLEGAHPALTEKSMAERWAKYVQDGKTFGNWDAFLGLLGYIQLQKAFGWEPYKKVFAEYEALSEAEKPKTLQQKHDQWLVRMSRATGHNLAPFYEKWNMPFSVAARDAVKNLPAWMPEFPENP